MTTEYRAAYLGDMVITGPEHAHLSDSELLAEALRVLDETDPDHATDTDGRHLAPRHKVEIGTWREL